MVMFDELCNFFLWLCIDGEWIELWICLYEQIFVKDHMDGHDASFVYLVLILISLKAKFRY